MPAMEGITRRQVVGLGLAAALAYAAPRASAEGEAGIDGRAVDADGSPLAGASVSVTSPDLPEGEVALTADASGGFRLTVGPGLYDVVVELPGYRRGEWRDVRVQAGRHTSIAISLERRDGGA